MNKAHKTTEITKQPARSGWFVCLTLAISILAIFWQVREFDYVAYDDEDYVAKNEMVQRGLTVDGIAWAFTARHAANWHPLTWLSHMLDCEIHDNKPGGHHFTNVLFHLANSLLLFALLRKITGTRWQSALVAALFALHPAHVESVAWLAERKDVLSTFFAMLTLLTYATYVRVLEQHPRKGKTAAFYLLTLTLFACGLMSKPMVVTLPFVLLLLDWWPLNRINTNSPASLLKRIFFLVLEKVPFFILTAVSCFVTFQVQLGKTVQSLSNFSIMDRVSNVLVSYVTYVGKLFWPAKLAFFYPLIKAPPVWQAAIAGLILMMVTMVLLRYARRLPYALTGWLWFLGTLVPVIGLVHVGEQSHADRYTYIPSIGFFIAVVWTAATLVQRWRLPVKLVAVLATAVLITFAGLTWKQAGYWKNNRVMLERALVVTTNNFLAHNNYGVELADDAKVLEEHGKSAEAQSLLEQAISHYDAALRVKPAYARAWNNRGSALTLQGKLDEAVESFQKALSLRPDAQTHHNLALALARQKKYEETIFHCREALRLDPSYGTAHFDLALALSLQGEQAEAVNHFEKAIEFEPNDFTAHYQLGLNLLKLQKPEQALTHLKEAARLKPDWVDALNRVAWIRATHENQTLRNAEEAVQFAEQADKLTGHRHVQTLTVLAAAYAEARRFEKAVQSMQTAVTVAQSEGRSDLINGLQKQLQLYRDSGGLPKP